MHASLAFYRDVLGLPFLFDAGPDLAFLALGDVRLMLSRDGGPQEELGGSVLYLRVASAQQAHAAVVGAGGTDERGPQLTATMPDHELWIAFVRDPDGRLLGLMEERPPDPGA
jgi:catechol 2,3-dioxygenase-like lactoylglutathione lyase family enzyme